MRVDIQCSPAYALAYCYLESGQTVRAEAGAMAAMSAGIVVRADAGPGGVAKGLLRKTLGGESFFMSRFTSQVHGAWVAVAPKYPGDIAALDITPERGMVAERGAMLAIEDGLNVDVKFAGLGNILMREGATMQRIHGLGKLLLCTYGGMQRFDLGAGESIVVDTGHLVAYSERMRVSVGPLSGLVTAKLSGEGLVAQIEGPGTVLVQTRAEQSLHSWLMPEKSQNGR